MTPDVNVLVAASRSDHPHHGVARAWLEQALAEARQGEHLVSFDADFRRLLSKAQFTRLAA